IPERNVVAVPQPFANWSFPGIDDETRSLLGSGQCLELRRLQPPRLTRLVAMHGFSPELAAHPFQAVEVDPAAASNRPEPPCSRGILQIAAYRRIDGSSKHTLSRQLDNVLAVRRTKTIMAMSQKSFYGGRRRFHQRVQFRDLDEQRTREFERSIFAGNMR